jgi:thiamine-phosphate pyrophosphorylase
VTIRPGLDLSLYLVTDTTLCGEFGVPATVRAAVQAGVTVVQLRDPHASDDDIVSLGRAVVAALEGTGVPLLVNDRVHLVEAIGAQGAHIGQGDLSVGKARALLGPDLFLGLSVQTLEHLAALTGDHSSRVDYLGVGPVWPQQTKPDAAQASGLAVFGQIARASAWPSVAIGGLDASRAASVRAAGGAGVAIVSAICGQADVGEATRLIRAAWDGGLVERTFSDGGIS